MYRFVRPAAALDSPPCIVLMAGKPYGETPIYNGPYVD